MEVNDRGERKKRKNRGSLIVLLLLVIILCTAVQLFGEFQNYSNSEQNYDEVKEQAVAQRKEDESKKDEEKEKNTSFMYKDKEEQQKQVPIAVDFGTVKNRKEGEHVIGWLYVEAVGISYPILQGSSNQQYLRKNLDGEYDICGSVFMDAENSSDFTDPNTIIFGHNMADGSMFGRLKEFSLDNALQTSPYVWVITEQQEYCYRIFSVQVAEVTDECYTLFSGRGDKFADFLRRMRQNSMEDTGEFVFSDTDSILTLSTCNGNNTSSRYVIQALRIQ